MRIVKQWERRNLRWGVPLGLSWWLVATQTALALAPQDRVVLVSATTQSAPAQIVLQWPADDRAASYVVARGPFGTGLAGNGHYVRLADLPGTVSNYTDTAIRSGEAYEYFVTKYFWDADRLLGVQGQVFAGLEVALEDQRGKVILLLDDTLTVPLADELNQLQQDLVGDGWTVLFHTVARQDTPLSVWQLIKRDFDADPDGVKAVFLLGRLPRFLGGSTPDGHPDDIHYPDDSVYGIMSGTAITNSAFVQSMPRADLQVGRVDLSDMPAFAPLSEVDLLRRYLRKDHRYRHRLLVAAARGLVSEHFGTDFGLVTAAHAGWANFAALFGATNVVEADWLPALQQQSFLWAYGGGPGTYTSASGIVATTDMRDADPQAVFTILFGSYFCNWTAPDNLMRAVLATQTYGLTCVWCNLPIPLVYHTALGRTIGSAIRYSQNAPRVASQPNLMGDPTLRVQTVAPPTGLQATPDVAGVRLAWASSSEPVLAGYHVYRSPLPEGPYVRQTSVPVVQTSFVDTNITNGLYTYMVRAVKLEQTGSGAFFNASQGAFATADFAAPQPVVTLSAIDTVATDDGTNAGAFRFTRTGPTDAALNVSFAVSGTLDTNLLTASLGVHLSIPAGSPSALLPVSLRVGSFATNEPQTLTLQLQPDAAYLVGQPSTATLDARSAVEVTVVASIDTTCASNSPGQLTFTRKGSTKSPLAIHFALGGTAVGGRDFTDLGSAFTIPAGMVSTSLWVRPLFAATNWQGEESRIVVLNLTNGPGYRPGLTHSATVRLLNHDRLPVINLFATVPVALEEGLVPGIFTVTRSGNATNTVIVMFSSRGGTASVGIDYVLNPDPSASDGLVLPYGVVTTNIAVTPIDDPTRGYNKTLIYSLLPNLYYDIGPSNAASILLQDTPPDRPPLGLFNRIPRAYRVTGAPAVIDLIRAGLTNDLPVQLTYGGTALSGVDYQPVPNALVIPAGTNRVTLRIVPIPNVNGAGDKTLTVTLVDTHDYSLDPSTITTTATVVDVPYNVWRSQHFGTNAANPLVAGPSADPDHDGYSNIIEYVFGLDPNKPNTSPPVGWPVVTALKGASSPGLTFRFRCRYDVMPDYRFDLEYAPDLTSPIWRKADLGISGLNKDGTANYSSTLYFTPNSPTNLFLRFAIIPLP